MQMTKEQKRARAIEMMHQWAHMNIDKPYDGFDFDPVVHFAYNAIIQKEVEFAELCRTKLKEAGLLNNE